jgi:hypothetical protein
MKRCPSCQKTYPDDAPDYCSTDGMRLVNEEAAEYDPEKTVMASGLRVSEPEPTPTPQAAPTPPQSQAQSAPPEIKPPTEWQPQGEQPAQQWQQPSGQPVQPVWSPSPQTPNWGGAPYQQPAANAPYQAPYAPTHAGRSRALSIAALVTGACAVTVMSLLVVNDRDFVFTLMLIMAILGIGLGVTALILSLQKPARFGGVPLAIAGLATGTAALVYYFTL